MFLLWRWYLFAQTTFKIFTVCIIFQEWLSWWWWWWWCLTLGSTEPSDIALDFTNFFAVMVMSSDIASPFSSLIWNYSFSYVRPLDMYSKCHIFSFIVFVYFYLFIYVMLLFSSLNASVRIIFVDPSLSLVILSFLLRLHWVLSYNSSVLEWSFE